jgi:hypothetical protein
MGGSLFLWAYQDMITLSSLPFPANTQMPSGARGDTTPSANPPSEEIFAHEGKLESTDVGLGRKRPAEALETGDSGDEAHHHSQSSFQSNRPTEKHLSNGGDRSPPEPNKRAKRTAISTPSSAT